MKKTVFSFARDTEYTRFENGADAYLIPSREENGAVVCTVAFPRGSVGETERTVAHLWELLMPTGMHGTPRARLREQCDDLGVSVSYRTTDRHTLMHIRATTHTLIPTLDLVGALLQKPIFLEKEFTEAVRTARTLLEQSREDTRSLARGALTRAWFAPSHPHYETLPDDDLRELASSSHEKVHAFHERVFSSSVGMFFVVGGAYLAETTEALRVFSSRFSGAPTPLVEHALETKDFVAEDEEVFVKDKMNIDTLLGAPLSCTIHDTDFLALSLGVAILGDSSSARLFSSLRTKKSFTYGSYARLAGIQEGLPGMFFASAIFPDTVFLKARKALKEECERWATDGVSAKEVSSRKEEVLGKRVVMLAPLTVRAHVLADALRAGKSLASLDEYPEKIEALSRAEVNHAIHIHLDPTHFRTASAGSVPKG